MNVIKKSNSGLQSLPIDSILLLQRKIFLYDEITTESANLILKQLIYLREENNDPINIYISSPGGEVNAGLMLYDQLKGMTDITINMYCTGLAASMAAIILAGGQKGTRFILPHSKIMIHEPLIAGCGITGSATSIQQTAESIMETKKIMSELLARDTGRSVDEIIDAISYDHYMNATEAIEFGIVDAIVQKI